MFRALGLKSGDLEFKSSSDHTQLDLFLVFRGSTPELV